MSQLLELDFSEEIFFSLNLIRTKYCMFEQILVVTFLIFPFTWFIGYIIEVHIGRKAIDKKFGYFNPIVNILTFIGVFVHELSHRLTSFIVRMPARDFTVAFRNRFGEVNPHGHVTPDRPYQCTLLQGILVSIAPVLIGTWIIYFSLMVVFSPLIEPIYRIAAGVFCVSVLLAIAPSSADIRYAYGVFQNDPEHSIYQLFLVGLSFLGLWWLLDFTRWYFPLEFVYYFFLIAFYYEFKYLFIGISLCFKRVTKKQDKYRPKRFKRFARRRFKPKRIRYEEVSR